MESHNLRGYNARSVRVNDFRSQTCLTMKVCPICLSVIGAVKPMENEVEWGTDMFRTMEKGNLCGDGSTYCARPSHYPSIDAIARALKKNKS